MEIINPLALLGLLAVAAAAAVALFRPARQIAIVSHLRLWERAIEATDPRSRRQRTVTASWLLLLAGAVLAVCAASRMVWMAQQPSRYVCITLVPSAELANEPGPSRLRQAARALLGRLGRYDRVRLILPARLGGPSELLTRDEAIARVAEIEPVPVKAEDLSVGPADGLAQRRYRIGPATLARQEGPTATDILLSTTTPTVTIDALAAEVLPDGDSELMLAVVNHTAAATTVEADLRFDGAAGPTRAVPVAGGQRKVVILPVPADVGEVAVSIGPALGQSGTLTRVDRPDVRVLAIGRANPFVRRFLRAMPGVVATLDPSDAQVILAVGAAVPPDRPGLAIDSPAPPPGWRIARRPLRHIALRDASVLGDHPLMRDVRLDAVAVASVRPLLPAATAAGDRLVTVPTGDPDDPTGVLVLALESPRRLYIAIDPAAVNTNWGLDSSFLALMANALTWLSPEGPKRAWTPADRAAVLGLSSADTGDRPADAPLPEPLRSAESVELWPVLAAAAGVRWLAGWWRRPREGKPRWAEAA